MLLAIEYWLLLDLDIEKVGLYKYNKLVTNLGTYMRLTSCVISVLFLQFLVNIKLAYISNDLRKFNQGMHVFSY